MIMIVPNEVVVGSRGRGWKVEGRRCCCYGLESRWWWWWWAEERVDSGREAAVVRNNERRLDGTEQVVAQIGDCGGRRIECLFP